MATPLNTIKNWFKTGLKPTEAQFVSTWDSFRHKDEPIPANEVSHLDELLIEKADKEYVDALFAASGNPQIIELTYDDAMTAIAAETLVPGNRYRITDVHPDLYGGTTVVTHAVTSGKLAAKGFGLFTVPKYEAVPVYGAIPYAQGQRYCYGGKVWVADANTDDLYPYSWEDKYTLNASTYSLSTRDEDYRIAIDEVEVDWQHNFIVYRNEGLNHVRCTWEDYMYLSVYLGIIVDNPIKDFQWGRGFDPEGFIGIANVRVDNSYFNNINFCGQCQFDIEVSGGSVQDRVTYAIDCVQQSVTIANNSAQLRLEFGPVGAQYNVRLQNNTLQDGLYIGANARQSAINMIQSSQYDVYVGDDCFQQNIQMFYGIQAQIMIENSGAQNFIRIANGSLQQNIYLSQSSQINVVLDNDSSQSGLMLINSDQRNVSLINRSQQSNLSSSEGTASQVNITFDNFQVNRVGIPLVLDESNMYFQSGAPRVRTVNSDITRSDYDLPDLRYSKILYILDTSSNKISYPSAFDSETGYLEFNFNADVDYRVFYTY